MPELKEMEPTYKIFILDEDEFNGLHKYIPKVNEKDLKEGLGFANPKTRECYVKKTGFKELDDETIIHEAMELLAKHSSDEDENNIRWKKGGALKDILPAIVGAVLAPFTGGASLIPILGGALTGAGMNAYAASRHPEQLGSPGMAALMGGVTGGLSGMGAGALTTGAIKGGTAAAPGFLSKAGGIVKGALGMTPAATTGTATTGTGGLANQFAAQQASQFGTPLTLGGQTSLVTGGAGGLTAAPLLGSALGAGIGSTLASASKVSPTAATPLTSTVAPTAGQVVPATTPATAVPKTFMEQAKGLVTPQNILGAGSLLASTAGKTPQFQIPSQFTELQSKLMTGQALSPLGQQAQMELGNILKATPTELMPTANDAYYEAALRRTRESYAEAAKQLDAAYNVAGVYGSGEHLQAKADLQEELARTESAMAAEIEQRRFELATNAKYQAIQQALGVEQNVMQDLLGLTGLSVSVASSMYNADVNDVTELRKALGTLGSELLIRGTTGQIRGTSGININLGTQ